MILGGGAAVHNISISSIAVKNVVSSGGGDGVSNRHPDLSVKFLDGTALKCLISAGHDYAGATEVQTIGVN